MDEPWPLGDKLSSVAADLLSNRRFEMFLCNLFATPSGSWQPVADCCSGLAELPEFGPEVFANHGRLIQVSHLPFPGPTGEEYSFVLFVHTEEGWFTAATYNRSVLKKALTPDWRLHR